MLIDAIPLLQLYAVFSNYLHAVALANAHDWIPIYKRQMISDYIIVLMHIGTTLINLMKIYYQIIN